VKFARILLLFLSLIFALTLAEAYIRLFHFNEVDAEALTEKLKSISIRSLTIPSSDPDIYYRLKPDLNIIIQGVKFLTNKNGFRIPEKKTVSQSDSIRIAVIGDSTSFGWKVPYEYSYPEVTRKILEEKTGKSIEMKNFSVPGYNSLQELYTFKAHVVEFHPDILILHHDHNDADPASSFQPPDFFDPHYGDNILHSDLMKFLIRRFQIARNMKDRELMHTDTKRTGEFISGGYLYDRHLDALEELAIICKKIDCHPIAILYASDITPKSNWESGNYYIKLHKNVQKKMSDMGYEVLDLFPEYQKVLQEKKWSDFSKWWISAQEPKDSHPNIDGHKFIAETLAGFLQNNELLK